MTTTDIDAGRLTKEKYREKVRTYVAEQKSNPCADCGGTFDPVCMDFDHRPGTKKVLKVSTLMNYGIERVRAEIAKCDLVCANCHRLRTHNRDHRKSIRDGQAKGAPQLDLLDATTTKKGTSNVD